MSGVMKIDDFSNKYKPVKRIAIYGEMVCKQCGCDSWEIREDFWRCVNCNTLRKAPKNNQTSQELKSMDSKGS